LYAKKQYVKAGLYSRFYKVDDGGMVEGRFEMKMPVYYGETLMETEEDFELPHDFGVEYVFSLLLNVPFFLSVSWRFFDFYLDIFVDRKPKKPLEVKCNCVPPEDGSGGCTDNCLNRCMFMECSSEACPCGDQCTNQNFQKNDSNPNLEVYWTEARGYGLRTTAPIPRNSLVIEYRGDVISQNTCIDRMSTIYKDYDNHYFLNYAPGEVIDACRRGTEARFVNHCCEPNCHIEKWSVCGEFCVGVFASEDIPAGKEITYDYRFEAFGPMQRCLCGAPGCRGDYE
ncbi:hypothetical protein BC829DRAFT_360616, partial [Chytridium lagenaria]